jgi:hypothetical protein
MNAELDYYSWAEFKDAVLELLPLDKDRLIQGDDSRTYIKKLIRQGVRDIQFHIPAYRNGHETVYLPSDFVSEGKASRAVLPPQAAMRDCWVFNDTSKTRHPVVQFDWSRRFELVNGRVALNDNQARLTIDPHAYTFYLYPELTEGWLLSVFWDSLNENGKQDFQDQELVPFDDGAADAVAEYVQGHLRRTVDKDLSAFGSYFDPRNGSYVGKRRNLYLESKRRGRINK